MGFNYSPFYGTAAPNPVLVLAKSGLAIRRAGRSLECGILFGSKDESEWAYRELGVQGSADAPPIPILAVAEYAGAPEHQGWPFWVAYLPACIALCISGRITRLD